MIQALLTNMLVPVPHRRESRPVCRDRSARRGSSIHRMGRRAVSLKQLLLIVVLVEEGRGGGGRGREGTGDPAPWEWWISSLKQLMTRLKFAWLAPVSRTCHVELDKHRVSNRTKSKKKSQKSSC